MTIPPAGSTTTTARELGIPVDAVPPADQLSPSGVADDDSLAELVAGCRTTSWGASMLLPD